MKLALVIPWFGRELKGGAEQHAWQVAARLAARGHKVEVLTTCCRSHQGDWATNHLPEGLTNEPEGFAIRRFRVDPRDRAAFDSVSHELQHIPAQSLQPGVAPVSAERSRIFVDELIRSASLLEFLEREKTSFDRFIFMPYLYGPVLKGIAIVGERAALQPCLHDEAYAYLPEVAAAFQRAGLLFFNSEGEQELALRLFGPAIWRKARLIGEGVEVARSVTSTGAATSPRGRFVLYLGRKDQGKNVPLLVRAFARFRRVRPNSNLRLLLAGHGAVAGSDSQQVEDLGLVSEEEKEALLRQCVALFQPSENESFSRVLMEAWMHGKPVAAHSRCRATAVAVRRADGGWTAGGEAEWAALFARVDTAPAAELARCGENGRRYAEEFADWDKAIARYELAFAESAASSRVVASAGATRGAIDQFLPNMSYGDAISNHAIWIREQLRNVGFASEIHARYLDPRSAHEAHPFAPEAVGNAEALIYHHSTGSEITPHVLKFKRPKCLVYHNITPAEFFEPFWPEHAAVLRRGRDDLAKLAADFPISAGVSRYNADELASLGFRQPGVLPISVDPSRWDFAPDPLLMEELQDGRTNLLFVGRIAPNKRQDDLVRAFERYLRIDLEARLILVGKAEENDPYATHLDSIIDELGLRDSVLLPGSITDAQLAAYWRTASVFWSMTEHEGFCVPLVEAMWFDVPIVAFRSSAVPETLGKAGLMFTDKDDIDEIAALVSIVVTDERLRRAVIDAQRMRRLDFLPERTVPLLATLAQRLQPAGKQKTRREELQLVR